MHCKKYDRKFRLKEKRDMLKEIRKLDKRSKANYIRGLQYRGRIKTHLNERGYICYDPEELKIFQKNAKRGRPPKLLKQGE